MKLCNFALIFIFVTGCSSINLKPVEGKRELANYNYSSDEVLFNYQLIKQTLHRFQDLKNIPDFKNRNKLVEEEFKNCSIKIKKNIELNNLFELLKINFSNFLVKTIELYECENENTSSAWIGPFSVFYENNFYFEIIQKFGKEEGEKLVTANLAHEIGHLIHEYSTLKENSGIDGLSVSGLLSKHYDDLRPPFCEREFNRYGSYRAFGCKLENSHYAHYEVDAFGIALLLSVGFKNPGEYTKKFLDYYIDRRLANETDKEYIDQKKKSLKLRKDFIDRSSYALKKYFN